MDGSGEGNLDGVGVEERPDLLDDGAGVAAALEGDGGESARSTAGSSASSAEPPRQEEFGARPVWEECRFCLGERAEAEGRLFSSPCLCRSTLVHRYCIQERINRGQGECPWCHAAYPVRVHSKPLWKWFWEKETRAVAFLFVVNMFFSVGDMGVLAMAWMYALFEFPSTPWLPAAALASTLFVFSLMWVAFGCVRFHVLHKPLEYWKNANTTREVLIDDDDAEEA